MTEEQNALLVFMEELGEVAVEMLTLQNQVSKAIRFGVHEQRDLPTSNFERINSEFNDLIGSLVKLHEKGVDLQPVVEQIFKKFDKIGKYEDYSRQLNQITPKNDVTLNFKNPITGETKSVNITEHEIKEHLADFAHEKLSSCDCVPTGESTHLDCNFYEYFENFELV